VVEHVWDINPILHENGALGSFLKGLLGYNGNPSFVEVIAYPLYLGAALYFFFGASAVATRRQVA
jgi:high-affinity Fe2+/Pb2+ permease